MNNVQSEYEMISHSELSNVNFFLVNLTYRAPHLHNDIEIIQVIEGGLNVKTAREDYDLGPGEIALFNSNEFHSLQSTGEYCILLTLQASPSFCSIHYPAITSMRFLTSRVTSTAPLTESLDLIRICFNLGYNYYSKIKGYEFRCISDLYRLFWYFITFIPYESLDEARAVSEAKNERRLVRILNYIHQNYQRKITLSEIAEIEHLSMTYLSHLFKNKVRMSFQEYVNSLRFEHAVLLLKKTDLRIIDICLESGFSDSKYLNKMFLQAYQKTPKEFRSDLTSVLTADVPENQIDSSQYIYNPEQGLKIMRKHHHFDCDYSKY